MKRIFLALLILAYSGTILAQRTKPQDDDNKIIITLSDSIDVYQKVKEAFINTDIIVKDLPSRSEIKTYPKGLAGIPGYFVAKANIVGNTVILTGLYNPKKIDFMGSANDTKETRPVAYYKGSGSGSWEMLLAVAEKIGGSLTYGK